MAKHLIIVLTKEENKRLNKTVYELQDLVRNNLFLSNEHKDIITRATEFVDLLSRKVDEVGDSLQF